MEALSLDELKNFDLTCESAGPEHFRVLVADDGELDRFLTIQQLGKAWPVERNLMVECAADGAEALAKIRRNCYALVVLDWNMPHQNGGDVLRALRADGLRIPVVVVSGQPREAITLNLETMAATYVNKDELEPIRFGNAIAVSMQLQEARGSVCSDLDRMRA